MARTAVAIAFVLVAAGVSAFVGTPAVTEDESSLHARAASSSDCPSTVDFEIAESHVLSTKNRQLTGGEEKIGRADVQNGTAEDLMVHLETSNDKLEIEVFFIDPADDECGEYDPSNCDQTVTTTSHVFVCQLDATEDRDYWVHYTNGESDKLEFHTWTPDS